MNQPQPSNPASPKSITVQVQKTAEKIREANPQFTASAVLEDGTLVEMLHRPAEHRTLFAVWKDGAWREEKSLLSGGVRLVPFSPHNNLVSNRIVLFPSAPEEYGTAEELLAEIRVFIHRYLDVTPVFERIAAHYVLFSWLYDNFNELPYLRARGDYGSGKTRFLLTIGSLCYKPVFASGASTVSPIFRILDAFRGTLIIDEGDFRASDEKAEIVKILNNGNVRGFPVLRSEAMKSGEFNPHAFAVFGPKLVATRAPFDDKALESRFLTEETGTRKLREDIPINLPDSFQTEAQTLRNKLLLFRFRNFGRAAVTEDLVDRSLEPRLNQIFAPLLSIMESEEARNELRELARACNREMIDDRGMDTEAGVLEIIRSLSDAGERLTVKEIAQWFADRHGEDYDRKITPRYIGWILRVRLQIRTRKSRGVYGIAPGQNEKLARLWARYGIESEAEAPDEGLRAADPDPDPAEGPKPDPQTDPAPADADLIIFPQPEAHPPNEVPKSTGGRETLF